MAKALAAISPAHMIADAGTRNILLEEIHDILESGAPRAPSPVLYNDYSLAERDVLAGDQGAQLIEHWRRWYHDQPTMLAPSDRDAAHLGQRHPHCEEFHHSRRGWRTR